MASPNGLVLWVLGGTGIILLYSAYKGQNPLTTVQNSLASEPTSAPNAHDTTNTTVAGTERYGSTVYDPAAAGSYSIVSDVNGMSYVYDADGTMMGAVPAAYAGNPHSYIPPASMLHG